MSSTINLNADLGESYGAWTMGADEALMPLIGAANIACGFHAGDPLVIRQTLALAARHGVSVGAHPSYPDLQGFGRRRMEMDDAELEAAILYQIAAVDGLARVAGLRLGHVKPHGALSNAACDDPALAAVVAAAVRRYDAGLILLAPALSKLAAAGRAVGLIVVDEVFADRAYRDDGRLVPRSAPGALIHGADAALAHVLAMLAAGALVTQGGARLATPIGSICVHGDGPDAVATARLLRDALPAAGYELVGLGERE